MSAAKTKKHLLCLILSYTAHRVAEECASARADITAFERNSSASKKDWHEFHVALDKLLDEVDLSSSPAEDPPKSTTQVPRERTNFLSIHGS